MHEKNIKQQTVKQLKKNIPNWKHLTKKEKKELAKDVLKEVVRTYEFNKDITESLHVLTGTPAIPEGIIPLDKMEQFIADSTRCLFDMNMKRSQMYIKDDELKVIDALLSDTVLNILLSDDAYTPSMRTRHPCHFFRAELLKSLKYPEMSYRKYCTILNSLESKTERAFVHLSLRKKETISHSQLSQFRSRLTATHMVNTTIYALHILIQSGKIPYPFTLCGVDSTDCAVPCNAYPLATITVGDKKVRIYSELNADCGTRRSKRNKSAFFVGYRIHTLAAIDPETGNSIPVCALIAPANHHDTLFLSQLVSLSKAMGLGMKIITADEAYRDVAQNESIQKDTAIHVIASCDPHVKSPEHVDENRVYMNEWCDIPMKYAGRTDAGHEFACGDTDNICLHASLCDKYREVSLDAGHFGQIPDIIPGVTQVRNMRKHMEKTYNLLKHREGIEHIRITSQQGVMAVVTIAQIAELLLEITGTRKTEKKEEIQQKLALGV
jgi:hypothetical protein